MHRSHSNFVNFYFPRVGILEGLNRKPIWAADLIVANRLPQINSLPTRTQKNPGVCFHKTSSLTQAQLG
jgi:hypothetical protein